MLNIRATRGEFYNDVCYLFIVNTFLHKKINSIYTLLKFGKDKPLHFESVNKELFYAHNFAIIVFCYKKISI